MTLALLHIEYLEKCPDGCSPTLEWGEDDLEIAFSVLVLIPVCCACLMW